MATPVQLQNLPAASSPLDATKFTHYNDGTTDFRATVAQMQAIIISALNAISVPQPTDLMVLQQGSTTGKVFFGQVGFTQGTSCWFYQNTAPMFWSIVGTADTLLAVKGGSQAYNVSGGTAAGTWQQTNTALTIDQMPVHNHDILVRDSGGSNSNDHVRSAGAASGGNTNTLAIQNIGGGQGHNHGNIWRPFASIGIICQKQS